jgi:VCBS repeat-containing protein
MNISRKRFLETVASGSALLLFGSCGGGGSDYNGGTAGGNPMLVSSCTPDISANHGHVLAVAVGDLDSTTPRTYNIQGGAAHSHSVTFSVAQLRQLRAGDAVTVTSTLFSGDGHTHDVTVTCVIY